MITDRQYNLLVNHLDAPFNEKVSISEALQWVRKNKGIYCGVNVDARQKYYGVQIKRYIRYVVTELFDTHPLAESALLDAVLTYLMEKKDESKTS